ncbi:metallophosphoesterase family protein [Bernardetia sp.]|uniref:metallophosphoesterase family protein n=1 Tax=Bernardetia sp. TaxID=1937974 RepID=UPI0025C69143|nr:metallophosphoesterase family protein [Bernardetia sp.]
MQIKHIKIQEKPKGKRFAIGDIHGCSKTFKTLVEDKVQLTKDDHLFLLGDYIDKGLDSIGVLDYILYLKESGFQVFPLMGNHEYNLLEAKERYNERTFKRFLRINKNQNIVDEQMNIKPRYQRFLESLPYYYELEDYHLVHAGFDFRKENPFQDFQAMLYIRRFEVKKELLQGKKIIHGHTPTPLSNIRQSISSNASVIPLDNGCIYTKPHKMFDYKTLGNLCCLDLDSLNLAVQRNIENK